METRTELRYETPVLLDAADLAGNDIVSCGVCITGGGSAVQR
jgi:hypothetical protein